MKRALVGIVVFTASMVWPGRGAVAEEVDLRGRRVRVGTASPAPLVGVVTEVTADWLMVQSSEPGGATHRVSRDSILGLEVSRGMRRHTVRGLVGGALAWAAVAGLYAAFDTLDESGVGEPLFIGAMVGTGGLVGSQFKTERWKPVSPSEVTIRVAPCRQGAQAQLVLSF
jgi:hypothetical protein